MSWVLVIIASITGSNGGVSVQTIEMATKKHCDLASAKLDYKDPYTSLRSYCVEVK